MEADGGFMNLSINPCGGGWIRRCVTNLAVKKIERSPIYTPKFVSKFSLQPLTLSWFNFQPQTLKTVQNYPFHQFDKF
jgi:hypothetical protein